jgi:tetratricopeptide (TPR) repeat protein
LDGLYHFCEIRGRIHENEMFLEQTIKALQEHLAIGAKGDPGLIQLLGKTQAQLGAVYIALIARKGATTILQQSLASVREPRVRAFALGHLGYALSLQGEDAEADALLHESLAISRSVDDLPGQAYGLLALSWVKRARGEYLQSAALGRESLAIYRVLDRPDRIARALTDLAVVEDWLGEYEAASDHLNESLVICRALGYRHGEARALSSLGEVAHSQGKNLEQAMALMGEALRIYQSTGHVSAVCFSLADLSWMASARGVYQQALQLGNDGVTMARSLQDDNLLANTLTAFGVAQIGIGDLVGARRSLTEALTVARSLNNVFCMLLDLHYLADLLIQESRLNEDEHAQSQALEWLIFLQNHPASWQTNKEKAARLEAEIVAALSAEQVAAASARGKMWSLDEIVSLVLNQT